MAQVDFSYWNDVLDIIYKANEHLDQFDQFRTIALKEIRKRIRVHSASFFLFDDKLKPTKPIAINLADQYLESYQTHYHRINPFDPIHVRIPSRWVLLDTDVSDYSMLKTSSFYTEFLKPQHTVRQMMLYLKSNQKLLGFIGLHRADERDLFSDTEMSIAEKVAPFLSQSLEKARLFQACETKNLDQQKLVKHFGLTDREIEVVTYVFKGFKNTEIADFMKIKTGTVKNHMKKIFNKMGVSTRTSLIYEALALS